MKAASSLPTRAQLSHTARAYDERRRLRRDPYGLRPAGLLPDKGPADSMSRCNTRVS
jgi:hypothetical protein